MEDERLLAKTDSILKKLASEFEFEGEIYSSDDELNLPFESNDISDDIDEIVFREQIRDAKKFFHEITGDDDDDDDMSDILDEAVEVGSNMFEEITLKPSVKYPDALSYFETALELNSKMRDTLLSITQALLDKKLEYEDMIKRLEGKDEDENSESTVSEEADVITWGFPAYYRYDGVIFTNKMIEFSNQFSMPYFKDRANFHCPPYDDDVEQNEPSVIYPSDIKPSLHWTPQCIETLEYAIKKFLVNEFKSRADFKAIYQWREYNSFVKIHSLDEVLKAKSPDFKLDWLHIAKLLPANDPRTPLECSKLWNLYLSPKFSKEDWTPTDDDNIIALAKKYDEQDWDKVAKELDNGKSAFQIFSYYLSRLRNRVHFGEKWTPEEDAFLKSVILSSTYGNYISWKKVMYFCENRTYTQVYNRWQNNLACKKKGKFSMNEDRALINAMSHGMGYRDTAIALGGSRTQQQIRERLHGIVKFGKDDALNIGDWSVSEDTKLLELIEKHGGNYSAIAKEMKTRDRTQCRHRFMRLKKYLEKPDFTLQQLDRRRKKSLYSTKIRSRKKNLMKLLTPDPLPETRKRKFVHEMNSILDDDLQYEHVESITTSNIPKMSMPIINYLKRRGSGFWTRFDHPQTSETETKLAIDCCNILNAKFKYDFWVDNDEHLNSVKGLFTMFKERNVCDATLNPPLTVDGPSTSITSQRLPLVPPNFFTCSGFLNSLSYCCGVKIIRDKTVETCVQSEEVERAKDLFFQRLMQLFLWPAILTNKDLKNRLNTYGRRAIKLKVPGQMQY